MNTGGSILHTKHKGESSNFNFTVSKKVTSVVLPLKPSYIEFYMIYIPLPVTCPFINLTTAFFFSLPLVVKLPHR